MKSKKCRPVLLIFLFIGLPVVSGPLLLPVPAPSPEKPEIRSYEFTLSPGTIPESPLWPFYSRREVESFLCAAAPGFIELSDVYTGQNRPYLTTDGYLYMKHKGMLHRFFIRNKEVDQKQREMLESREINKWFEEPVTLICKGHPTAGDIKTMIYFIDTVNQIIGREKFVYSEEGEVGNIIVEFSGGEELRDGMGPVDYIGESACLADPMRVAFYRENEKMKFHQYRVSFEGVSDTALFVKYSPAEEAFGKKNRVIKIHIANVSDRKIRDMALIHELFHSLGICGHSPYMDSHLFPLPIPVGDLESISRLPSEMRKRKISPLGRRMVEMLYRPEILPGMSLKEAGQVLAQLKHREKTSPAEIKAFLEQRKRVLETKKTALLEKARPRLERREEIQRSLPRLDAKKEKLQKEVKKENKLAENLVKDMIPAVILRLNIGLIKGKLKRLETRANQLPQQKNMKTGLKNLEKQIVLRKEDIQVLSDILAEVLKIETRTRQLKREEMIMDVVDEAINQKLRRVIRQLSAIDQELERL